MRMDREKTDGPMISAIGRAGFKVDDGYYTALSISPERADGWEPPAFEALGEADVATLLALDPPPEFLLLGTGSSPAAACVQEGGGGSRVRDRGDG